MEERCGEVEPGVGVAALADVVGADGCSVVGVLPPFSGTLPGHRDHRVEQHQPVDGEVVTRQCRAERSHRLRHQNHLLGALGRRDDGVGLVGERHAGPVRQVDRYHLVTGLLQPRGDQVPVGGVAPRAVDQDKSHGCDCASP